MQWRAFQPLRKASGARMASRRTLLYRLLQVTHLAQQLVGALLVKLDQGLYEAKRRERADRTWGDQDDARTQNQGGALREVASCASVRTASPSCSDVRLSSPPTSSPDDGSEKSSGWRCKGAAMLHFCAIQDSGANRMSRFSPAKGVACRRRKRTRSQVGAAGCLRALATVRSRPQRFAPLVSRWPPPRAHTAYCTHVVVS